MPQGMDPSEAAEGIAGELRETVSADHAVARPSPRSGVDRSVTVEPPILSFERWLGRNVAVARSSRPTGISIGRRMQCASTQWRRAIWVLVSEFQLPSDSTRESACRISSLM